MVLALIWKTSWARVFLALFIFKRLLVAGSVVEQLGRFSGLWVLKLKAFFQFIAQVGCFFQYSVYVVSKMFSFNFIHSSFLAVQFSAFSPSHQQSVSSSFTYHWHTKFQK
jgi:hypothetical protein